MWYILWWLKSLILLDSFLIKQTCSPILAAITLSGLLCMICVHRAQERSWTPTLSDYGVVLFTLIQLADIYKGIYGENSAIYGAQVAAAANVYFIIRFAGGISSRAFRILAICACILGLSLAAINIPATIERFEEWHRLDLHHILAFRGYFYLAGGGTKTDSLNLALALLPFSFLVLSRERMQWLRIVAIVAALGSCSVITIGMSRGVYLGYLCLCIGIVTFAATQRVQLPRGIRFLVWSTFIFCLLTICCYAIVAERPHSKTSDTTSSESRSISGRLDVWRTLLSRMEGHDLLGVGGGNGALFTLEHIEDVPDQQLIARTYNWALQVFLQNGLLGLIAFTIIPLASLVSAQRLIKSVDGDSQVRQSAVVIQGAIVAILVSDLTYTSVVLHPPVMCLFFGLAGAINGRQLRGIAVHSITPIGLASSYGVVAVAVLVSLYFSVVGLRRSYSEVEYSRAAKAMQNSDYNVAIAHLMVAENNSRCDALYRSMKGLVLVRSLGDDAAFVNVWQRKYVMPQKDRGRVVDALRAYQDASECAPMDAELHNNWAWLDVMLGDYKTARVQLDMAKQIDPEAGLYHLSSGLLYEREGRLKDAYDEYSTAIAYSPHIMESEFFSQLSGRSERESERVAGNAMMVLANASDTPIKTAELARLSYTRDSDASTKMMLTGALSQLPALSYPWYTLGEIAETEGDAREAILDYKRSLFMDPMNRATLARLASIENATGNNYEALQAAEAAVMRVPVSEHAVESEMMYGMDTLSSDDVVPSGLLDYTLPHIRVENLCKIIYQKFGVQGLEIPPDVIDRLHVLGGSC